LGLRLRLFNGLRDADSIVRTVFNNASLHHGRCATLTRLPVGQRLLTLSALNRTLEDRGAGTHGLLGRLMVSYTFQRKKVVLVAPTARGIELCDPGGTPGGYVVNGREGRFGQDGHGEDEDERGEDEEEDGGFDRKWEETGAAESVGRPMVIVVKVPAGGKRGKKRSVTVRAYPGCDNARSALMRALRLAKVKSLPRAVVTELVREVEEQAKAKSALNTKKLLPDTFTCRFAVGPTPGSVASVVVDASWTPSKLDWFVANATQAGLLSYSYQEAIHRVLNNVAFGSGLSTGNESPSYSLDAFQFDLVHPVTQASVKVPMIAHIAGGSPMRGALWSRYHEHFVSAGPAYIRDFSSTVQVAMATLPWSPVLSYMDFHLVTRCVNMSSAAEAWAREAKRHGHPEPPALATMDAAAAQRVAAVVREIVDAYKIRVIADIGCGDGTPLPEALSSAGVRNVTYIGLDLPGRVKSVPEPPEGIVTEFRSQCALAMPPPPSDLIILRRVLEFLPYTAQRAALRAIASSNPFSRYILVSTNARVGDDDNLPGSRFFGDYRPVNLNRRPYGVSPIQMWSDGGKGSYLALYAVPMDGFPERSPVEADSDIFIDSIGTTAHASFYKEDPKMLEKWQL
jgi:hypothetical protein